MKRSVIPELLDDDLGDPGEVAASLADLRRVNRWFGGSSTSASLLRSVAIRAGLRQVAMLDVAAASGDVTQHAVRQLADEGIALAPVLLDRRSSHFPQNSLPRVCGDATALPFADDSFDVVHTSLFLHHLEPDEVQRFAGEALRVCRHAVVINDLRRHPVHLALVYAGMLLYRSRLTRHDATASVPRAYTPAELETMLRRTNAARVEVSRHYLYRMGVIAWKHST